jgi:hypothetical protein
VHESFGVSLLWNGYAPTTRSCTPAAASSSAGSLPIPKLRMNATAMRDGSEPLVLLLGLKVWRYSDIRRPSSGSGRPTRAGRTRRFD